MESIGSKMARAAPAGSPGAGWGDDPRTRRAVARAECQLGEVFAAESGFLLARNPDTVRAPDFAFIQASRTVPEATAANWIPVMPDLVVEVVSSSDWPLEIAEKVRMWRDAGVRLVWVVYPTRRAIEEHRPQQAPVTLAASDQLDGGDVVPGFTLPVVRVFG
jgi:Uma2 family endonuclease